jgi:hypothetical protein
MAVVDRNSNVITNAIATPRVANQPAIGGAAQLMEVAGLVTCAADDSANSIHRFVRVPSNARISSVLLSTADASSAGNIDIGIYQTASNGGAVVDADLFASAFALTGGPFHNEEMAHESGEYTFAESVKPLWEVLGLSEDPCREYDVAATITTGYNGAGTTQMLKVRYVI